MTKMTLGLAIALFANFASADAVYQKGEQSTGIAGDNVSCLVESAYSTDGQKVTVRTLVADPHDSKEVVALGPVEAAYDANGAGYLFRSSKKNETLQALVLNATSLGVATGLSLIVLDGGHSDGIACEKLTELQGQELLTTKEKFEHFGEEAGDHHDHNHDHGHDHNHGHKH